MYADMCAAIILDATAGGRQQPTEPSELGRAEQLQPKPSGESSVILHPHLPSSMRFTRHGGGLSAKWYPGTNQKKDLRILKSGDLRQKLRKDLGNQSACPPEQLYSVCTPAGVGIGADKLSSGLKFRFSERRGHTVATCGGTTGTSVRSYVRRTGNSPRGPPGKKG